MLYYLLLCGCSPDALTLLRSSTGYSVVIAVTLVPGMIAVSRTWVGYTVIDRRTSNSCKDLCGAVLCPFICSDDHQFTSALEEGINDLWNIMVYIDCCERRT